MRHWTLRATLAFLAISVGATLADVRKPVAITESLISPHLQFLAGDECQGRRTGEKGNEIAARYIAEHFRHIGLVPLGTSKQRDPNAKLNGSGYFQPFAFIAGSQRGKANSLEAVISGQTKRYRLSKDFEPASSASTGTAKGPVVFVGYGNTTGARDDYAGVDAKGKIALAVMSPEQPERRGRFRGMELQRKVQAARDAGAAALVVALANEKERPTFNASARPGNSGLPVLMVRRAVAEEWLRAAGKNLGEIEKTLSETPASLELPVQAAVATEVATREEPTANIIGLLPGSDPELAKEYLVIGAHMDHLGLGGAGSLNPDNKPAIHYGADDNASGTAGMMALAEYFASLPVRPKRSMLFMAFSGEELGLLGSIHYTKNPIVPLEKTVAMLNLDMIGRAKDNKVSAIGVGTSPVWHGILDEVNKTASFQLARSNSGFGGSDHQSFYNAGVPVLFFFTGTHPDYHRPSDTFDKINVWDETRIVQMVADIAARVAEDPKRPEFVRIQAERPGGGPPRRSGASLGIMPEYSAEVAGVPVGGLRSGGPAEKAGVKVGDIVIRIAGKSIRNIEEYMAVLADRKPGEKVEVTVKRGAEEITVTLTLAESVR